MMRSIAGLTAVTAVILVCAPPAAAATDPVGALKARLAPGKGVKFTDVSTFVAATGKTVFLKRTGTLEFDRKGIKATDISAKYQLLSDPVLNDVASIVGQERAITVGKVSYSTGGNLRRDIPEGVFIKLPKRYTGGLGGTFGQPMNPADPSALTALISAGHRSGHTYTGKMTFGKLSKVSPWYRESWLDPDYRKDLSVEYRLTLGSGNLPQKIVTTFPAKAIWLEQYVKGASVTVETRFTGWGSRVHISLPPASKIVK
jgi:hypothetical protein